MNPQAPQSSILRNLRPSFLPFLDLFGFPRGPSFKTYRIYEPDVKYFEGKGKGSLLQSHHRPLHQFAAQWYSANNYSVTAHQTANACSITQQASTVAIVAIVAYQPVNVCSIAHYAPTTSSVAHQTASACNAAQSEPNI